MNMNLSKLWEIVEDREALHPAVQGVTKIQILLSDWTTTATKYKKFEGQRDTGHREEKKYLGLDNIVFLMNAKIRALGILNREYGAIADVQFWIK